jgi:hypothetical protein
MSRYKSAMNEPEECPTTCGHPGATPHSYLSCGITVTTNNCPECHQYLSNQIAVIAKVRPEHQHHAHAVVGRAIQIGLSEKTILRVLRALAKISNQDEEENEPFTLAWPHWCWDNFHPATGTALAFPTDDAPPSLTSEPGLGGRRRKHNAVTAA